MSVDDMHVTWWWYSLLASEGWREAWRPSNSRCIQEPLVVRLKDREPPRGPPRDALPLYAELFHCWGFYRYLIFVFVVVVYCPSHESWRAASRTLRHRVRPCNLCCVVDLQPSPITHKYPQPIAVTLCLWTCGRLCIAQYLPHTSWFSQYMSIITHFLFLDFVQQCLFSVNVSRIHSLLLCSVYNMFNSLRLCHISKASILRWFSFFLLCFNCSGLVVINCQLTG